MAESEDPDISETTDDGSSTSKSANAGSTFAGKLLQGADSQEVLDERDLERAKKAAQVAGLIDDLDLRKSYAKWLLIMLAVELAIVNAIFVAYCVGNHWRIPTSAIDIFLSSTVVELFSVILVVTRYIFPKRDDS